MMSGLFNPTRTPGGRPGWGRRSLRTLLTSRSERNRPDLPLLTVARERGVFVRTIEDDNHNVIPEDLSNYKVARQGDLVINKMKAWQGSLGLAPIDGIVSPAYFVFDIDVEVPGFGEHLLRSKPMVAQFGRASDGVRVGQWDLNVARMRNIEVALPAADEQAAIVKYLAHANARIDNAIAAKRRLVGLLRQTRRALVDELVLGIGRRDIHSSSAPWLATVPIGWEWRRCRTLTTFVTSGSRGWAQYYADDGAIFLQSGNLGRDLELKLDIVQRVELPDSTEGIRTRVHANDVLVCITGALTGNVALVPDTWREEAYVNQHVALMRPRPAVVYPPFLAHALSSLTSRLQFKGSEYGGTKQGLGLDEVKNVEILMPPMGNQIEIVAQIRQRSLRLDQAIARARREMDLLNEFRERLVADVVTGGVDVRGIAAFLPDDDLVARSVDLDIDEDAEATAFDDVVEAIGG